MLLFIYVAGFICVTQTLFLLVLIVGVIVQTKRVSKYKRIAQETKEKYKQKIQESNLLADNNMKGLKHEYQCKIQGIHDYVSLRDQKYDGHSQTNIIYGNLSSRPQLAAHPWPQQLRIREINLPYDGENDLLSTAFERNESDGIGVDDSDIYKAKRQ